jgi:hypothetical protein
VLLTDVGYPRGVNTGTGNAAGGNNFAQYAPMGSQKTDSFHHGCITARQMLRPTGVGLIIR